MRDVSRNKSSNRFLNHQSPRSQRKFLQIVGITAILGCATELLYLQNLQVEGGHSPLRRSSQQPTAHTHPSSSASDAQRCARGVPISQQPRYCCQGSFLCRAPLREGADQGVSPARELTSDSTSNSSSAGVSRGFEAGIGLRQTSGIKESSGFRAERAGRMTAPQRVTCSQVNDDFCDCDDGSDEPGTAACGHLSSATFLCRSGATIPAAFVDDRVCDCCDGSDEMPGVKCIDRCTRP